MHLIVLFILFITSPVFAEEVSFGWGNNKDGQISLFEVNDTFIDFDAGVWSSCFVLSDGSVKCQGCDNPLNDFGQCSTDKISDDEWLDYGGKRTTNKKMTTVSTSFGASCGINSDNQVECWGCEPSRQNFQCAIPNEVNYIGAKIPENPLTGYRTLDVSESHTCAVLNNGDVNCWGCEEYDDFGQCADIKSKNALAVSISNMHSCLVSSQEIYCWGDNSLNQLNSPKFISSHIIDISSSYGYNAAVDASGRLYIWGDKGPFFCSPDTSYNCFDYNVKYKSVSASSDYLCAIDFNDKFVCVRTQNNPDIFQSANVRTAPNIIPNDQVKAISTDDGVTMIIVNKDKILKDIDTIDRSKLDLDELAYLQSSPQLDKNMNTYYTDYLNHIGMEFKTIEAGSFYIGGCSTFWSCLFTKNSRDSNLLKVEHSSQKIEIHKSFQIGIFEVTISEYKKFLKSKRKNINNYKSVSYNLDHYPVIWVSWYDAQDFVNWLNETKPDDDYGVYRLPTEAEWEYAARAGTTTVTWLGDDLNLLVDNHNCIDCIEVDQPGPLPVGSFKPNPWGLYDMFGNVDEWVQDCVDEHIGYEKISSDGSAYEPNNCEFRGARGGSWEYPKENLRSAWRDWYRPEDNTWEQGFRVVRELP